MAPPPQVPSVAPVALAPRRGRRRPRARTGSRLLVAARSHEEARDRSNVDDRDKRTGRTLLARRAPAGTSIARPRSRARPLRGSGVRSDLELQPGTWTVGGGVDDGIHFPGLPLAAARARRRPRTGSGSDATSRVRWGGRCSRPESAGGCSPANASGSPGRHGCGWSRPTRPPARWRWSAPSLPPRLSPILSAVPLLACVVGPDAGPCSRSSGPAPRSGGSPGCAVRLADGAVSRRHLLLEPRRAVRTGSATSAGGTARGATVDGFVPAGAAARRRRPPRGRSLAAALPHGRPVAPQPPVAPGTGDARGAAQGRGPSCSAHR